MNTMPVRFRQVTIDDAPELARILTGTNAATFRGLVPDKCLVSPTRQESETNWRRALSAGGLGEGKFLIVGEQVASSGEPRGLVGYVLAGGKAELDGYERELNVLMVDPPWQRRGIGRKLVARAVTELQRQGVTSMLVGVQVDNPNRVFYEKLGGRLVGRRPLDWAGYKTEELLYGWQDLRPLVQQAP
jgi:ribosomal protein S18 acetylase RimI-like enzyme